jgi:hypothetical protein
MWQLADFEKTNWFQQIASILTIIAIPYAFLKLVVYKAKHKITFETKETYHEAKLIDYPSQPQSFWLHLMVENKGYEMSRNVEAYISEIWIKKNNKYEKLKGFNSPIKLKWAHERDIYPINIFPKEKRRLDICYICQGIKILYLMTQGFPSGSIKNAIEPNDYLFLVKVVGENSLTPVEFIFQVSWNGEWKTLSGNKYVKSFKIYKKPVKSFSIY